MELLAKERQSEIYKMLKRDGAVTASALVTLFNISFETVRRDLLEMEKQGLLSRVHGGAVEIGNMKPFLRLDERNLEFAEQKRMLSLKAAEFIKENDIIGIDTGSTAISFAEMLKHNFKHLTVVTHSLDVFEILNSTFDVILCGGCYLRNERSFYGPPALEMLGSLHMRKCFVFPSAVSLEFGIGDYNTELLCIQKMLIKSSDEVFVLADSSKLEKKALLRLDEMRREYIYVTDGGISGELSELYAENGIKIFTGC